MTQIKDRQEWREYLYCAGKKGGRGGHWGGQGRKEREHAFISLKNHRHKKPGFGDKKIVVGGWTKKMEGLRGEKKYSPAA